MDSLIEPLVPSTLSIAQNLLPNAETEHIVDCLTNEPIKETLDRGFLQIQSFNILPGLISVQNALNAMQHEETCNALFEDVDHINFERILAEKLEDLFTTLDYLPQMEAAVRRMERGQTEEDVIAEFQNLFSLLITPDPLMLNNVNTAVDIRPIIQVFEGVVLGFGETVSVSFADCVHDGQVDFKGFESALSKIATKNVKQVYEGVKELGQIAQELPKAIEECKGSKDDFKALFEAAERIKHPMSFAYHVGKDLYVNHVDIFKHTEAMLQDFNDKKYVAFGKEIGIVLELVLVGKQ